MSTKHGYVIINNILDYEAYKLVREVVGADTTYAGINKEGIVKLKQNLRNGDTLVISGVDNLSQRPSELHLILKLARDKNIKLESLTDDNLQEDANTTLVNALLDVSLNLKADKITKYPPYFLDILEAYEAGESWTDLAKKYNINIDRLYSRIHIFKNK